ncbi:MAG: hypothetical protein Q7S92_05030 [Candidatus Diapherotrites archaeon]|nr:hypothetical protein [Candidatus Diapherotrites archaeon]
MNLRIVLALFVAFIVAAGIYLYSPNFTGLVGLSAVNSSVSIPEDQPLTNAQVQTVVQQYLAENPMRASYLNSKAQSKLNSVLQENPGMTKEAVTELMNTFTRSPEEEQQMLQEIERNMAGVETVATGGYEENFIFGGRTFTETELKNMTPEQQQAFIEEYGLPNGSEAYSK